MLSFLRTFILISFFLVVGIVKLHAQIQGQVAQVRGESDSVHLLMVSWPSGDEQKWNDLHGDRLEIPCVQLDIVSENLPGQGSRNEYVFHFPEKLSVELLITIDHLAMGESLVLMHRQSGEVIFTSNDKGESSVLTPAFDPEHTQLVWSGTTTGQAPSRFVIRSAYIQRKLPSRMMDIGFGAALSCHPNTKCKEDSLLQVIANTTVRMRLVMEEGIGWCSGSFMNTTRQDKTPYVLSAFHCQYDFTPMYDLWRFDFEYLSDQCANPAIEPQIVSLTGCQRVAGGQASDFLLLLLDDAIPSNQPMTFAGWDREDKIPDTSYLIHHPRADIRKISTCHNTLVIHPSQIGWTGGYSTPPHHHFRFKFTEGGHEAGSSGGPLFNEEGFLVGQLHGGTVGCEIANNTYVGRLFRSWDTGGTAAEQLQDWLDPDQTGIMRISSLENIASGDIVDIYGQILDPLGRPVKNVEIIIEGDIAEVMTTGEDGRFMLESVNRHGTYTIKPRKIDFPLNGLNVLDLLAIQKHLLGIDTFDFDWQYIAADAAFNGFLNASDILTLLSLMLGKTQFLPTSPSWRFEPQEMTIGSIPPGSPVSVQIMGIKIGDVNGSADPQK